MANLRIIRTRPKLTSRVKVTEEVQTLKIEKESLSRKYMKCLDKLNQERLHRRMAEDRICELERIIELMQGQKREAGQDNRAPNAKEKERTIETIDLTIVEEV